MITTILFVLFFAPALSYRMSQCTKANEMFSLCTWKCPPTCVNLRMLWYENITCLNAWECRSGCQCRAGFVKDEYSKECVLVQNCPVATIIVVSSAPTHVKEGKADRPLPLRRVQKRSNPVFPYQTPCEAARAAAASSAVPVIAPPTGYHFLPDERYAYPYAYDLPYYREDQDSETLQFSDMDPMMSRNIPVHHYPTSRSYQPHHQYAGIPSMPSLAVFPGTESRKGCGGVPLLFSCSPSIVQGHLGHAHPYYNYQEQTPVHGYPEYHYEDSVLYRQGMPELMDEERNINHLGHQLTMAELQAINQQAAQQQALQQQALQQQALQQHAQHQHALHQQALSQQAQEEQLMNHNQHQQKSTQQKNDKPAEPTSQADSQQDLSLTS